MTRPGIEPHSHGPLANTLTNFPILSLFSWNHTLTWKKKKKKRSDFNFKLLNKCWLPINQIRLFQLSFLHLNLPIKRKPKDNHSFVRNKTTWCGLVIIQSLLRCETPQQWNISNINHVVQWLHKTELPIKVLSCYPLFCIKLSRNNN